MDEILKKNKVQGVRNTCDNCRYQVEGKCTVLVYVEGQICKNTPNENRCCALWEKEK